MILGLCLEVRTNRRPLRNDSYVVGAKKKMVGRMVEKEKRGRGRDYGRCGSKRRKEEREKIREEKKVRPWV